MGERDGDKELGTEDFYLMFSLLYSLLKYFKRLRSCLIGIIIYLIELIRYYF